MLGPNGAGKTTVLQVAATLVHPSSGTAEVLDERIGRVDVFELRPRIGLASSALAAQVPDSERVRDVVLTSAWAVLVAGGSHTIRPTSSARGISADLGSCEPGRPTLRDVE